MSPSSLLIKLYLGCPLTSEIRMHLKTSHLWNQALIVPKLERELVETRFQQQEYLGRFFDGEQLSLERLKAAEKEMRELIQSYCPKLNAEKLTFCVFPQIFLP